MRRAAKVDANQAAMVKALRKMGASVQPLHTIGSGCPDILVGWRGENLLIEIKDGTLSPSRQKLTPDEAEFHGTWRGHVSIARSVDDLRAILDGAK